MKRYAGYKEMFSTGRLTYLSPLPLPTMTPPTSFSLKIGAMNDRYMDLGGAFPSAFGWQLMIGVPVLIFFLLTVFLPMTVFVIGLLSYDLPVAANAGLEMFLDIVLLGLVVMLFFLLVNWAIWFNQHGKRANFIPIRFNRQRREVCFGVNEKGELVNFQWESLSAWVVEAQGVMEYGVQRQYGLGIGYIPSEDPTQMVKIEFSTPGIRLAIGSWETIRAYMEYEIDSLSSFQKYNEVRVSESQWEGLHAFNSEKQSIKHRYERGEVGLLYFIGWYLYHACTLWSVPYRLVDWEVSKIKSMPSTGLPPTMEKWSAELPEEERVKPSQQLIDQSERVRELQRVSKDRSIFEIFNQVSVEFMNKGGTVG